MITSSEVLQWGQFHSSQNTVLYYEFENYTFKITATYGSLLVTWYKNIFPQEIFFSARNLFFSARNVFFLCKKYFSPQEIYFIRKKYIFSARNKFFSARNIFFPQEIFFYARNIFFSARNISSESVVPHAQSLSQSLARAFKWVNSSPWNRRQAMSVCYRNLICIWIKQYLLQWALASHFWCSLLLFSLRKADLFFVFKPGKCLSNLLDGDSHIRHSATLYIWHKHLAVDPPISSLNQHICYMEPSY